jgi:LytS/YehU family sensor histidine kinase
LSEFAALMRESLNRSNKEETSMNEELKTLETYLKLEQLRFGFQYTIDVDENINIYETSLPTLLLQPLVENAIKHGISHLQETGIINICFDKNGNTLKVIITDNGKGFNVGNSSGGYGLKLTSERIKLLNELNKEQPITFEINSKLLSGTQIVISFNYWFL